MNAQVQNKINNPQQLINESPYVLWWSWLDVDLKIFLIDQAKVHKRNADKFWDNIDFEDRKKIAHAHKLYLKRAGVVA